MFCIKKQNQKRFFKVFWGQNLGRCYRFGGINPKTGQKPKDGIGKKEKTQKQNRKTQKI
jgi:hypothetical protein